MKIHDARNKYRLGAKGRKNKMRQSMIFCSFFFPFFSTGTYVYFALSRNTSYSWKMRLQRPQAHRPFNSSSAPPAIVNSKSVTFIPQSRRTQATPYYSFSLFPLSLTSFFPSHPFPDPSRVCPFSLRIWNSPPHECRARLIINTCTYNYIFVHYHNLIYIQMIYIYIYIIILENKYIYRFIYIFFNIVSFIFV